jgi:hypothetical protein
MQELIGSRHPDDIPKIKVKWIRGRDSFDWGSTSHHICSGLRDSGKSALGEAVADHYPQIIDIFGSRDNEGLAWCRSGRDNILFVIGDNCDLEASWDVEKIDQLTFKKMNSYEVVITVPSFYSSHENYFKALSAMTNLFYKRFSFKTPTMIIIREAANFTYSRISKGETEKMAKADFIQFCREMRHFGYCIYVDTIRWTAVDKEMRDLADYVYIKDAGYVGLQSDISFLYRYIHPRSLAGLSQDKFLLLTRRAAIGIGTSEYPNYHKEPGENLLALFDLHPEFGEEIEASSPRSVGDFEHHDIVKMYDDGYTMLKIAQQMHRSKSTIKSHIDKHNLVIVKHSKCPICNRIGSDLSTKIVEGYRQKGFVRSP